MGVLGVVITFIAFQMLGVLVGTPVIGSHPAPWMLLAALCLAVGVIFEQGMMQQQADRSRSVLTSFAFTATALVLAYFVPTGAGLLLAAVAMQSPAYDAVRLSGAYGLLTGSLLRAVCPPPFLMFVALAIAHRHPFALDDVFPAGEPRPAPRPVTVCGACAGPGVLAPACRECGLAVHARCAGPWCPVCGVRAA